MEAKKFKDLEIDERFAYHLVTYIKVTTTQAVKQAVLVTFDPHDVTFTEDETDDS
jgi:hypothetical protein